MSYYYILNELELRLIVGEGDEGGGVWFAYIHLGNY